MTEQLIVLGNGFDLATGLKSSYGDFFNNREEQIAAGNEKKNAWDYIFEYYKDLHEPLIDWKDVEQVMNDFLTKKLPGGLDEQIVDWWVQKQLVQNIGFYVHFGKVSEPEAKLIKGFGQLRDDKNIDELVDVDELVDLTEQGKGGNIPTGVLLPLLMHELNDFESDFKIYLLSQLMEHQAYGTQATELLHKIIEKPVVTTNQTSLLNFNYTKPDKREMLHVKNVHGTLKAENIIFGIDSFNVENYGNNKYPARYASAIRFMKTYRTLRLNNPYELTKSRNLVSENTKVIKFFGHSLGQQDYSYFQAMFDAVDLYGSDVVVRFYYTLYPGANPQKEPDVWFERVNKLMTEYGATLDNKDHGRNLLHKLQLEGRLAIVELEID